MLYIGAPRDADKHAPWHSCAAYNATTASRTAGFTATPDHSTTTGGNAAQRGASGGNDTTAKLAATVLRRCTRN